LDHLRKVIAIDTRCAEAHEKARELHLAAGRPSEAAASGALAARAFLDRAQVDRARDAVTRLRQIAPDYPELPALNAAVGGTEEVDLVGEVEEEEEIVLSSGDVTDEAGEDASADALALSAARAGVREEVLDEDEAPRGADDEALVDAAARASAESEEVVDDQPRSAARAAPPAPRQGAAAAAPAARRPPPPPPEEEHVDLEDEIEEADFFVQQGLFDDARHALQNLLAFYPAHPLVQKKLREVEARAAGQAPVDGAPAVPLGAADGADASFDIARELAELGGGTPLADDEEFQYSVEDVFTQFKKGVEQTVKPEDSATHYDLGIAYKEMGLLDDAIHEFETALQGNDKKKEVDCLSMIGLCQASKGDGRAAIAAYRRALASDHLTRDAAKAIHYELAAAYEGAGDGEVALYYLQRVVKADPAFRDAAKRVAALGGGPGRPPPDEPRPKAGARPVPPGARPPPPPGAAKKNIGYL
ncbi:MAG TPA: hypothetical protein VFK90_09960, partial [Anaeromyxobacter sp.]|nr:hypothetical protein [Anaeromyxobacter sp.]